MLKYREYYEECLGSSVDKIENLYNFDYRVVQSSCFGQEYKQLISEANADLNQKLKDNDNIFTPPGKSQESQPLVRLKNPWDLNNIEKIAEYVVSNAEQKIFSCPAYVHGCYVYQTRPGNFSKNSVGSLLWHIDNHPKEVIKAMVYLNDVDGTTAPLEILSAGSNNSSLKIKTKRVDYTRWSSSAFRFTEEFVGEKTDKGYQPYSITGPSGTVCYFDNNVLHRANKAKTKKRNAIVFMMKPIKHRLETYISRNHTGTNYHVDVFKDPSFVGVIKK